MTKCTCSIVSVLSGPAPCKTVIITARSDIPHNFIKNYQIETQIFFLIVKISIIISLSRPNAFYSVKRKPTAPTLVERLQLIVDPLLKALAEDPEKFPRTIIYVHNVKYCGWIHKRAVRRFGVESDRVGQYTGPQESAVSGKH